LIDARMKKITQEGCHNHILSFEYEWLCVMALLLYTRKLRDLSHNGMYQA